MRKKFLQRTAAVMLSASLLLSNAGSALADTEITAAQETETTAKQEEKSDFEEPTTKEDSDSEDVTDEQEKMPDSEELTTEEASSSEDVIVKQEEMPEVTGEKQESTDTEKIGGTEVSGESKTEAEKPAEAAKQTEEDTKKAQAADKATEDTATATTAATEAVTVAETETVSSEDAVVYNLGSKEVEVSDSHDADYIFEDDGSYTISITEANPYFPYEVQFKCGDETTEAWFKSPADTVNVYGHAFSVQLDGATTENAYTTLSLQIGDEELLVYPEEKTFSDSSVSRFGRMLMAAFRVVSKRDETKISLQTVNLSDYSPLELSRVQLRGLFNGETIGEGQKVMWTLENDEDLKYTVSNPDDCVDLSVGTCYGGTNNWRMLVGADDQLKDGTIYTVPIKTAATKSWLQAKANAVKADGTSAALTVDRSEYYDVVRTDRTLSISANGDRSIDYADVSFGFTFNEEKFKSLSGKTIKVYAGEAETEQALSGLQDITEQILSGNYQVPEEQDEDVYATIVGYSDDTLIGLLPVRLSFYVNGEYLSLISGLKDEDGATVTQRSYKRSYTKGELSEYTIEYSMQEEKVVNGSYYARFQYYKDSDVDNSQVTAVYLGTFRSIEEAQKAGAKEIKDQILGDSGYKADYSNGVHFTFFMGKDGETDQEIERYCIKTKEYQKTEEKEYLSSDTYVQFTGLLDEDRNEIPCYFLKESADSYGEYNFPTLLVAKDVNLSKVYPVFETDEKITLYAKGSATPEESGKSEHDLSGGIIQYTASSEDKEFQRNYWLQVIKPTNGTKLFINSFADRDAETETRNGVIYSTREIMLDGYHDDRHDIIVFNQGTSPIENIKVELESDVLELDDYWTLKGTSDLSGYADGDNTYAYTTKSGLTDRAVNMADVRLTAKDDAKSGSDISGKLSFKSGSTVLAVLTLTGTIGDPTIITDEIPDAVKYVPYGTMIQNSNKYSWNHPTYFLYSGRLPKGMEILDNGELYGVPLETGEFTFTVAMENDFSSRSYYENSNLDEVSWQTHKYTMKVAENTDANVEASTYAGYELRPDTTNDPYNGRVPDFRMSDSAAEYTLVSNGAYAEFKYIWLDGEKLTEGSDYTSSEGSTRITLKAATLKKNGEGTHTLGIEFRTKKDLNTSNTSGQKRTSADGTFERAAQNYHIGSKGSYSGRSSSGSSSSSAEVVPVYGPANTLQVLTDGTWKRSEDGVWSFIGTDGKPVTGFKYLNTKSGAKWFYFYQNGAMATGWIVTEDGKWYYMMPDGEQQGAMQTGFVLDPSDHHWYMLKETSGELLTGWQTSNGKYYYFNAVPGKQGTSGWGYDEVSKKWNYSFMPTFAYGAMYQSATTPDGYRVDADGAWVK